MKASSPFNKKRPQARDHFENISKLYEYIKKGDLKSLSDIEPQLIFETRFTNYKRSILHLAVWYQQPMLVQKICEEELLKQLLNVQDINGDTPLHLAAYMKNVIIYRLLVQAGGNENIINTAEEKPLQTISDPKALKDFVEKLNSYQLNVNDTNYELKLSTDVTKRPSIRIDGIDINERVLSLPRYSILSNGSRNLPSDSKLRDVISQFDEGSCVNLKDSYRARLKHKSDQEENLSDSDEENAIELELSKHSSSQISKLPKTMSYLKAVSTLNNEYSRSFSKKSSHARSNKRFGSWLMTRIPNDTFYVANKGLPKPVTEPEDFIGEVDPDI